MSITLAGSGAEGGGGVELTSWDGDFLPRGVLDISLGGEVRHGPSYPDPV